MDYLTSDKVEIEQQLRQGEKKLLQAADLVTVNNPALYQLHKQVRPDIKLVPSGFRSKSFTPDHPHIKPTKNRVGYIGTISQRIDFKLLHYLCASLPQISFDIVGPVYHNEEHFMTTRKQLDRLCRLPNVTWYPYQPPNKIQSIISSWSSGIIPYRLDLLMNQYCQPLKVMEFFYVGIPVIAPPIPSLAQYSNLIAVCRTPQQWLQCLLDLPHLQYSPKQRQQARTIAMANSWEQKITTTLNYLE